MVDVKLILFRSMLGLLMDQYVEHASTEGAWKKYYRRFGAI
jgi:hypothetical protein